MELTGEQHIPATREQVWQALNDPSVLAACIAGCQELTRISDTRFDAVVIAKVGPVSPTFRGTVDLMDIDPPNGYTLVGRGQGGAAGFAKMTAKVQLAASDVSGTLLRYSAQAEVGGKLAAVGSRLIQGVARKTADDFFAAFARHLDPQKQAPATEKIPRPGVGPSAGQLAFTDDAALARSGGLGALVPAWLVVFGCALGIALGFCIGLLKH